MNTYKLLTSACLVIAALFLSCGGGDDDLGDLTTNPGASGSTAGDNSSTSTPPTVDEALLPFVGDFLLFDDGTSISPVDAGEVSTGKWSFDEKTQYLSNTATMNTFLLTLHDETTLLGVDISNNRTISFTKNTEFLAEELHCVIAGTWKSAEDTLYIGYASSEGISGKKVPPLPQSGSNRMFYNSVLVLTGDSTYQLNHRGQDLFNGEWRDRTFYTGMRGTIIVENPYAPSKSKLILTGTIEGTYTKISGY